MNFSLIDAGGLALSVLSYGPLLLLPGLALTALSNSCGFATARAGEKVVLGVVVGLALLPLLDSLAARVAGLDAALALNLTLAALALGLARRAGWRLRPSAGTVALLGLWFALVGLETVDFDVGGRLYQPFVAVDMVKHAATVQAIVASGTPPRDPFFLRPEPVSYYYFFYTLAALSQRIAGGLVDARAAVGGLAFWVGIGLYGLVDLLLRQAGLRRKQDDDAIDPDRRWLPLVLLATGGLDLPFVIWRGLRDGTWLPDPQAWNEQVASWFESLIWVPHHITALIALFVGFVAAVEAQDARGPARLGTALVAGACFASALGLSIWVTLAGAVTAGTWFAILLVERRWRALAVVGGVGAVAALLAAPQIHDLLAGRSAGLPVVLTIRAFMPIDAIVTSGAWRLVLRAICLPFNYMIEFGVLAAGTALFWFDRKRSAGPSNELQRVLAIGAIAGLALGTFLQSRLFNNDLGWRVVLLPSLAGLVWTIAALERRQDRPPATRHGRRVPIAVGACVAIGLCTTLYAAVGLRAFYWVPISPTSPLAATGSASGHALRTAYAWANAALPHDVVLQHNPGDLDHSERALAFGLYSANSVAVGDYFGTLFGADCDAVANRIEAIEPVFKSRLDPLAVATIARAQHIDALVVTADDPAWQADWVRRTPPLYASDRVRIVPVAAMARADVASLHAPAPQVSSPVGAVP